MYYSDFQILNFWRYQEVMEIWKTLKLIFHMYDGYQVYWMCGMTSIEFNSCREVTEIWKTLKLIFQLRNTQVFRTVLYLHIFFNSKF